VGVIAFELDRSTVLKFLALRGGGRFRESGYWLLGRKGVFPKQKPTYRGKVEGMAWEKTWTQQ
jgi:hypothetical protein